MYVGTDGGRVDGLGEGVLGPRPLQAFSREQASVEFTAHLCYQVLVLEHRPAKGSPRTSATAEGESNMSNFRRPNPRSNWKRPKPKIYDCNTRDLEKFYQTNYDEYLTAKSEIRSREVEREHRGDAELLTRRFEQRRASSLAYGEDDAPRTHRFVPAARQTSNNGSTEHSYLRTRLENSMEDRPSRDVRSSASSTRSVTYTAGTLNAPDSNSEMASIETRLERLRKLREELGLPTESTTSTSSVSSSTLYNSDSLGASSSSSRRQVSPPETRGRESSRWTRQGSAARSDSRSRASPARGAESSSYSSRTEQSSSLRNGLDDQGSSSYTSRTSRKSGADTNGYSSSYDTTSSSKGRLRVEKPSLEGLDLDYDDDKLLNDVRKKFPSSKEILDKIRNMDIE